MVQLHTLFTTAALYSAVAFAAPGMPMDMGMATTSTAMMSDQTSTPMKDMGMSSSNSQMGATSTSMMGATSTSTTMMSESTSSMTTSSSSMMTDTTTTSSMAMPTYGSGSNNWGNAYNDCVQQCVAQFGSAPAATYTPTATATEGSKGTGATHTIIVAPSAGVLRYVPFAVNASVGDTVKFMWGADRHTVTKGSQLELCNKTSEAPFASGLQNKSFVFEQVVNDTKPTFFYCAAPTHCQKGMFGIINPATSFGVGASAMAQMAMNSTNMAAMTAYSKTLTKSSLAAANWGSNIKMDDLPDWSKPFAAENIMYTQIYLAANKELISTDGKVDLGAKSGAPMSIPPDVTIALNAAGSGGAVVSANSVNPAGAAAVTTGTEAPASSSSPTAAPSSAGKLDVSCVLVTLTTGLLILLSL